MRVCCTVGNVFIYFFDDPLCTVHVAGEAGHGKSFQVGCHDGLQAICTAPTNYCPPVNQQIRTFAVDTDAAAPSALMPTSVLRIVIGCCIVGVIAAAIILKRIGYRKLLFGESVEKVKAVERTAPEVDPALEKKREIFEA